MGGRPDAEEALRPQARAGADQASSRRSGAAGPEVIAAASSAPWDDWRGRAARLGTACQQAACLSLIGSFGARPGVRVPCRAGTTYGGRMTISTLILILLFNALPGLTLGEHANGPRAHSVATQELEFEYRAHEALARWR